MRERGTSARETSARGTSYELSRTYVLSNTYVLSKAQKDHMEAMASFKSLSSFDGTREGDSDSMVACNSTTPRRRLRRL